MQNYLLVFAGGGMGAVARYWLSGLVYARFGTAFPYGTLVVNIVGCILIGFLMSLLEDRFLVYPSVRIFLTIGILGGFTTFSSFSFETLTLFQDGQILYGTANIFVSIITCVGGAWIGFSLGKFF
jgi:fluoride exporter